MRELLDSPTEDDDDDEDEDENDGSDAIDENEGNSVYIDSKLRINVAFNLISITGKCFFLPADLHHFKIWILLFPKPKWTCNI